MATLLRVPEVATGDTEATLTEWITDVGAGFGAGDPVATVETAKAAVEIVPEVGGVLLATLVELGTGVQVGQPIALVGEVGEVVDDIPSALAALGVSAADPELEEASGSAALPDLPVEESTPSTPDGERIFASPLARRLARESGVALADIRGTGPRGRIRKRDVETALSRSAGVGEQQGVSTTTSRAVSEETPTSGFVDVPHSKLRRAIARRLTHSVQEAPQFTVSARPRVDRLLTLRAELNETLGVRVSVNDLLVRAVAVAHSAVPDMNVVWTDDAVRQFQGIDVAVAVATEGGLVTPVVRGVDRLSITEVALAGADLVARARAGKLRQSELEGGTISISNLGMFGTRSFSAIINPPQAGILAVGAVVTEPVVDGGELAVAQLMHLTLTVDHRPVDGATAAQWMKVLVEALEQPLRLVLGTPAVAGQGG